MAALTASLLDSAESQHPGAAETEGAAAGLAEAGASPKTPGAAARRGWKAAGGAALALVGLYATAGLVEQSRRDQAVKAASPVAEAPTTLAVHHVGEDCWRPCSSKGGYCDWCGPGNRCCKEGDPLAPDECKYTTGFTQSYHHECVAPKTMSDADDAKWLQCVTGTGGTCNIFGCAADRGPTDCKRWGVLHFCICQEGYCSDIAGKCKPAENSLVAASVTFRNAQWPDYKMQVSGFNVFVSRDVSPDDTSAQFNVYEIPTANDRPTRLMLGSVAYPSYVSTTSYTKECHPTHDDSGHDDQNGEQTCTHSWGVIAQRVNKMSMDHVIRMFSVDWEEQAVMFESVQYPGRWWYVPHGDWAVSASHGDPGPQGYWIPDPPLPASLHLPSVTPIVAAANRSASG